MAELTMDWEPAAAAEEDNETSGGNGSSADSNKGGPCVDTRASGRVRWAARREQMGEGGRMPQMKGPGRVADGRSTGAADLATAADRMIAQGRSPVKYQCIGAAGEGSRHQRRQRRRIQQHQCRGRCDGPGISGGGQQGGGEGGHGR